MSASIQVFLRGTKVPSVAAWNDAFKAEGFDQVIDPFDLRADDGYRPAELHGRESGFEWYLSKVADLTEDPDYPFEQRIGDCDVRHLSIAKLKASLKLSPNLTRQPGEELPGRYDLDPKRFLQIGEVRIAGKQPPCFFGPCGLSPNRPSSPCHGGSS